MTWTAALQYFKALFPAALIDIFPYWSQIKPWKTILQGNSNASRNIIIATIVLVRVTAERLFCVVNLKLYHFHL